MSSMRFANLAFSLSLLALAACSTASNDDGSGTSGPSSSSAGGSGAEGGSGVGGEGAIGGAASTGQGGGGNLGPCGQDCSLIEAPDCYEAVCNTGQYPGPIGVCTVAPTSGTACDDGLFCTVSDTCSDGVCIGGPQNTCGLELEQCTTIACDETTMACSNAPAADGVACLDDDPCLVNAKCAGGLCVGVPKDCTFSPLSACNAVSCNPVNGQCEGTPDPAKDGNACSSGNDLCTTNETCSNGVCGGGQPKDCSNLSVGCVNGVCDPSNGFCVAEPLMQGDACLDGNDECNVGVCDGGGSCQPVPTPGVACASATDSCNNGVCNAAGVCEPVAANDGAGCSDGNSCTTGETCSAGACTGGQVGQYVAYFSDSFASNSAGWVFDTDWQIGPAMASSGGSLGPDPSMDHTPTADNGVAGVLIGGITAQVVHPFYYITSPVIDVSAAPGQVYLEFWRWLNSDYTPYMQNTIDVWNGAAWVNVWSSGPSPAIQDAAWTKFSYDLTLHKNAAMKVRFGYTVLQGGVYAVSSWNIDDLVIANQSCN